MFCKYAPQDLQARLHGTICRYRDLPYYVVVGDGGNITLCSLDDPHQTVHRITLPDQDFDISTPPLGYVNFLDSCSYLVRTPNRMYKQGINSRNTEFLTLPNTQGMCQKARRNLVCGEVGKSILRDFPSVAECRKILEDNPAVTSRASSRSMAFSRDSLGMVSVYYRNTLVGHILPNTNVIRIPSSDMAWIVSNKLSGFGIEID